MVFLREKDFQAYLDDVLFKSGKWNSAFKWPAQELGWHRIRIQVFYSQSKGHFIYISSDLKKFGTAGRDWDQALAIQQGQAAWEDTNCHRQWEVWEPKSEPSRPPFRAGLLPQVPPARCPLVRDIGTGSWQCASLKAQPWRSDLTLHWGKRSGETGQHMRPLEKSDSGEPFEAWQSKAQSAWKRYGAAKTNFCPTFSSRTELLVLQNNNSDWWIQCPRKSHMNTELGKVPLWC